MDSLAGRSRTRLLVALPALAAVTVFLATTFRQGWTRAETDFPNYYTAAVLVRKGAPLHNFYDWTWFQRQMNYAGVENQLGGYIPQTPLTMLPMVPFAGLAPQAAKRVWLLLNLGFLAATLLMLSRITGFGLSSLTLLTVAGWSALRSNFLLGQYYVFLLFLLTLAFFCMYRNRGLLGGAVMGIACALKLYGAPFLLFFAAKRQRRELAAMSVTLVLLLALAIALFGWTDTSAFFTQVLPRSLAGETIDPYHPANGTLSTLLRRTFVSEPELHPHPLSDTPAAYFFLQAFFSIELLALSLLAVRGFASSSHNYAWFVLILLFSSPNTASYTFILLLLPVALLLQEASLAERSVLVVLYIALTLPYSGAWVLWFPKVWLLLALILLTSRPYWKVWRPRTLLAATAGAVCLAAVSAGFRYHSYLQEPGRRFERIALQPGALYSSSPVVLRSGLLYQQMGMGHYVLDWFHDGRHQRFAFAGEALDPRAASPDGPILFELVAHGRSQWQLLDLTTGLAVPTAASVAPVSDSIPSPDGKWIAYTLQEGGSKHIWLKSGSQPASRLTGGACNSFSPAWELDSRAILFASDCDRGLGLPALYRAPVP